MCGEVYRGWKKSRGDKRGGEREGENMGEMLKNDSEMPQRAQRGRRKQWNENDNPYSNKDQNVSTTRFYIVLVF